MKKIVTPNEMRELDRKAIQLYGIAGETLMENAGRAVYEFLKQTVPDIADQQFMLFCGKGNNGGDGFVIARYLAEAGIQPQVWVFGQIPDIRHDALLNFNRLVATGLPIHFVNDSNPDLPDDPPDILIDALLGTGAKGDLEGWILKGVECANHWKTTHGTMLVAVDIPSGLDGETGYASNNAILADVTITMGLPKKGLVFGKGKKYTGHLTVADIGLPDIPVSSDYQLVESADVASLFAPREPDAYKYHFGKVLVIAGSKGMSGAALLTSRAVLRAGAGMLKTAVPEGIAHVIENGFAEALCCAMPQTQEGSLSMKALEPLRELMLWCDVMAIGPGISRHPETSELIIELIRTTTKPTIVDADAIIAVSQSADLIRNNETPMIFTPHTGEFAAMAGVSTDTLHRDRLFYLTQTIKKFRKILLLKGSPTLIASPNQPVFVSYTGNPGMATAGSGDVLTGIIAAFLAQGLQPDQAAYAGAFIHGLAGDMAAEELSQLSLNASDLITYLPQAIVQTLKW